MKKERAVARKEKESARERAKSHKKRKNMRRSSKALLSRLAASAALAPASRAGGGAAAISFRIASGALASTSAAAVATEVWKPAAATLKIAQRRRSFTSSSVSSSSQPPPPTPATHAPPCWSCGQHAGTARPSLVCGSCRAVQPLELVFGGGGSRSGKGGSGEEEQGSKAATSRSSSPYRPSLPDPFSLLGLPRSFDVDPKALEASYRALQAQLHPDKHHSGSSSSSSVAAAAEASAAVNAAVALLRCPLARARFLLDGTRPDREDFDAGQGEKEVLDDPELLAEVMEAREEVEEAAAETAAAAAAIRSRTSREESGDSSSCPLALLRDKHERAANALSRDLSRAFARGDLEEARRLTVRLRYATRILQAVTDKM